MCPKLGGALRDQACPCQDQTACSCLEYALLQQAGGSQECPLPFPWVMGTCQACSTTLCSILEVWDPAMHVALVSMIVSERCMSEGPCSETVALCIRPGAGRYALCLPLGL